jgi:hypothetical protein
LGLVFVIGLIYGFAQGELSLRSGPGRSSLLVLLGGFFLYAALHGFFQFVVVDF